MEHFLLSRCNENPTGSRGVHGGNGVRGRRWIDRSRLERQSYAHADTDTHPESDSNFDSTGIDANHWRNLRNFISSPSGAGKRQLAVHVVR